MSAPLLSFNDVLNRFRNQAFSERDKGRRFEELMRDYLRIAPEYAGRFAVIWLWDEFPHRNDFGGKDVGIDLVAQTTDGDYWAIQCKCYAEDTRIDKAGVDSFLATSSKEFFNDRMQTTRFAYRLWISTTNHWNGEAERTIQNQNPPVLRVGLSDLINAPVDWDKLVGGDKNALKAKYPPKEHQQTAVEATHEYFKAKDRGKLIMACGTGKTFTALKIAEKETGGRGTVLFLVPSIALLGQTLREWTAQADAPLYPICVCSDAKSAQARENDGGVVDLALPASTDVRGIIKQYVAARKKQAANGGMIVVFSTYQSIDVISNAQKEINHRDKDSCVFDLAICDEAHRTTGVILSDKAESAFTKIHDNDQIFAKKRLYMTATPRLYTDASKQKAKEGNAILCSMDYAAIYGDEIYRIGFGEAVKRDLLSDYKVLILTIKEDQIPAALQNVIKDKNNEIDTDDVSKLIGCINALSKKVLETDESFNDDKKAMHTAVAFCQNIKASKKTAEMFNRHKDDYYDSLTPEEREKLVGVCADHIDGAMGAAERAEKLAWLQNVSQDGTDCRILCNVKCLSEGVDVPSLDAVMFLAAKNSQVDVVQSVGRVMRKSKNTNKKYGYIIIPIVIPAAMTPEQALDDNERYQVVWSVLNALRSHDDRFDAEINQLDLNRKKGNRIRIVGVGDTTGETTDGKRDTLPEQLPLPYLAKLQDAMYAKMVKKVGNRMYWVEWAQDVARIAERYIERINRLIAREGRHREAFAALLQGLRKNINPSITPDAVVQMLAQHLITGPVFEALFENYSFVANNPVSQSLQKMITLLEEQSFDKDTEFLNKFYESVKERVKGIDNAAGKQKVIVELYDKFFRTAFPKEVEKLGIVYTPIEVVDFINRSVAKVLKKEFGRNLSDENVHILDPFTGTGTFITRMIQTGLIDKEALPRKYARELHANEIVLLAYYIASINIENAYHDAVGQNNGYKPFNGICLTDTFQLGETDNADNLFADTLPQNSERVIEQKKLPVRVIIGNPPYSVGQRSANDNAQNQNYPKLDGRIAATYVKMTNATNKNALYDSYIKAFRWSTDRIDNKHGGIIAFVSNGSWLDNQGMDGFRKCLEQEFSSIYVFNLRGNCRTSGELRQKEAGNVFGSGSRTPITITILVKKTNKTNAKASIYYDEVADYLKREEKLELCSKYNDITNTKMPLKVLKPNEHGDWLNQRSDLFSSFIPLGDKDDKTNTKTAFVPFYSNGLKTQRDAWCYNSSKDKLSDNIKRTIDFYNEQCQKILNKEQKDIEYLASKFSWTRATLNDVYKNKQYRYIDGQLVIGCYRPFFKQNLFFYRPLNEMMYQIPKLFPTSSHKDLVICVPGIGAKGDFSAIITNIIPDLGLNSACQCFPLYYYEKDEGNIGTLFDQGKESYVRRDGITDFIYEQCRERYGHRVTKEDIFYYVYGLLHSHDYREQFAADLKKMLPRIPLVNKPADFWAFGKAGRALADLHLNYETVPAYPDTKVIGADSGKFRVEKMAFAKNGKDVDRSVIVYNSFIRIENIPPAAYGYVVNGKAAIEWIMDRYQIKTDKDSGITNDPNDWGSEHSNPRYILDLLLSIITVSVETVKIVDCLPRLAFKTP